MLKPQAGGRAPLDFDPAASGAGRARGAIEWAYEGLACTARNDHVRALQCFQRALETDIDCRDAWLGLSEVFLGMQDVRRADACLQVARLIQRRTAAEATA